MDFSTLNILVFAVGNIVHMYVSLRHFSSTHCIMNQLSSILLYNKGTLLVLLYTFVVKHKGGLS